MRVLAVLLVAAFGTGNVDGALKPGAQKNAHVRLITALSSVTARPGMEVRAVAIAPVRDADQVLMPPGTIFRGFVTERRAVGLGLMNERASLKFAIRAYTLPDGRTYPLTAKLKKIENGRETVTAEGAIRGVMAADSPQQVLGGVWTRPTMPLMQHALLGLTGANGRIWERYSLGPFGAAGLFALHCVLFPMPEPNIQLPAGAELSLSVMEVPEDAPEFEQEQDFEVPRDLSEFLAARGFAVNKPGGKAVGDIINVAFEGSREQLEAAFRAAGWDLAGPLNRKSFTEEYSAFAAKTGFAKAPASLLNHEGEGPAFVFQKSLNDVCQRHHVRIWRVERGGEQLWVGAATHDVGLGFDAGGMKFSHRIDGRIDRERSKIVNDLKFAGCLDAVGYVDRPNAAITGDRPGILTDGRLAFIPLHECGKPDGAGTAAAAVGTLTWRTAQRVVLEARQYAERENSFFWTYRVIKWTLAARRNRANGNHAVYGDED